MRKEISWMLNMTEQDSTENRMSETKKKQKTKKPCSYTALFISVIHILFFVSQVFFPGGPSLNWVPGKVSEKKATWYNITTPILIGLYKYGASTYKQYAPYKYGASTYKQYALYKYGAGTCPQYAQSGEHSSSLLPLAALVALHNFFQNPKRRTCCNVFDFMILITCSLQHQEVVTKNKNTGFYQGPIIKMIALYWRVGLIPAAAVICLWQSLLISGYHFY